MTHEDELVDRARKGDREALDELVNKVKDLVYNLAIRMLGSRADAEDATQEILIRLVTNLASFRGESAFRTWVYRVASNQLLKTRTREPESRLASFEEMEERLESNLAEGHPGLDDQVMVREAKLMCTSMMVLRLDRDHRLAFILGEILDLSSDEAAAVLEIAPDAFRKRLSRARTRMAEFTMANCGLVDASKPCRCAKQAACGASHGYMGRDKLQWADHPVRAEPKLALVDELDGITRALSVLRGHPDYAAPEAVVDGLKELLSPGRNRLTD